ncbi:hypothetical protein KIT90_16895 [Vibrio sp. B172a]|uniref:hypothetical protein n=1 Tax=Vibrio sp. B172a TaxID=2835790 RepID=UPI0025525F17|nr:hypothetical protein [Vibrio sp. B172a]MDK9783064.1 hypothetical protein [Vibrio sp. B172a]
MLEDLNFLIDAKAKLLGVSTNEIKSAMATKYLLDEEGVDDPLQMIRDIDLSDIRN